MAEIVHPASIVEETRRRYLTYALSVITSRALPDVRDGLKPVQRRILYCMDHDLSLSFDRRPVKCARIAGDVIGKYHPHSTEAAYDALVRMSQNWVLREPLVDGHGNFGSVDGDPPAAMRYTEAKLTAVADALLSELKQQTVPMRANYDGSQVEPSVLPAQFPHLLVNGSSGIAVGMATNIPPHNLSDTIAAAIYLVDNAEATTATLLDRLKGPDFPLGGKIITDRTSLRKIYEEGHGSIKVQAEWKVEEGAKKKQIIITSIPFGVNKSALEAAIGEIIANRKLPQLLDLTNESNEKEGLRIALDIKPETDPSLVMAYLFKHTSLQDNFAVNMTCLVPDEAGIPQPRRVSLPEMLQAFLDFRFATVTKRFEFELEQLRKRIHILDGFRIIFDDLDRAIKIIRQSQGKQDAHAKLVAAFELSDIQTTAILDSQLYRIAQMEIRRILEELAEKKKAAEKIEVILASKKKLWGVVKDEMAALSEKFGGRRRTRLSGGDDLPEYDESAYIVRENTNVVITRDGWLKRVNRLASVEGTRVREGDSVLAVLPASTLDHAIFFAEDGSAYTIAVNEIPVSSGYGEPITKYFKIGDNVKIVAASTTDPRFVPAEIKAGKDEPAGPHLLVVTQKGLTLRIPLAPYRVSSTKNGRLYVKLGEGDRVVLAHVLRANETSIFLVTQDGHVLHFAIDEVNILSGVGKGVIGIKIEDDDLCIGGAIMTRPSDAFQIETSGGRTLDYTGRQEKHARGGRGFEAVKRTTLTRIIPPPIELVNWDEIEGKTPKGG
ncbi:MAG: DNA topoisomerase IV subunit A [Planctomycetota bacterium]|jgi:DNA gyrase subunit A